MNLVTIAPGHQLESSAAASFDRAVAHRPGLVALVNSAYRTMAYQARLRAKYLADPRRFPFALPPSQSLHCKGLALDIDQEPPNPDHAWFVVNGPAFGWFRTNPAEPWHFEYNAAADTYAHTNATIPAQEDDDMKATPIIFDQHRQGQNDSAHPDFGSTGIQWPWGFERTSVGRGPRTAYEGGKAIAGLLVDRLEPEAHADITALALALEHGTSHGKPTQG